MNHNSIGTLSSSAQIWDPKNVYTNKILQKNNSSVIFYVYMNKILQKSTSSVIFYSRKHFWDPKFVHCYLM